MSNQNNAHEDLTRPGLAIRNGVISLNSVVILQEEGLEPETVRIVEEAEADPAKGNISDVSLLGNALLGKYTGEQITVLVASGSLTYVISKVINL